jgi:hypothetical protein
MLACRRTRRGGTRCRLARSTERRLAHGGQPAQCPGAIGETEEARMGWQTIVASGMRQNVGNLLDHCAGLPERILDAGEVVLQEGTPGPLFVLVEGAVEILKGDLRINVVDEPGSIFGEVSALLGTPPMATVRALERSRFFVADDGPAFIASNPEVAMAVARVLASRLMSVTSYLVDVKRQFEEHDGHLGIVDDVLESLIHDQSARTDMDRGSDREPDPNA